MLCIYQSSIHQEQQASRNSAICTLTGFSDRQFRSRFHIPHFTHRSANISTFLNSTFYFPHSAIPHFTNDATSDMCHCIDRDIDSIDNFNNNLGPEFGGLPKILSSGVGGKLGEREREGRGVGAERRAGVTKVGLSGERQIGRSRSAHMLCPYV